MTGPNQNEHYVNLEQDEDGWDYAVCACGWQSPPCPDTDTAADCYGDHRGEVG